MFIKCLVKSIKQRVIIIREDLLQHKDSINQPAQFLWGLYKEIFHKLKEKVTKEKSIMDFCTYTIGLIVKEGIRTSNNINQKHALINCLSEFLDLIPKNCVVLKL